MKDIKIGWIGLGTMGTPMAGHLLKAGYTVSVYNRSKEKEEPVIAMGALPAASPKEITKTADIIFLMVSDDNATRDIIFGDNGILSALATNKLVVNMSTVSPAVSKEMASVLQDKNNSYIDAPVSGSLKQAQEAQLVIMAGGDETVFKKAQPVLEHMGKLVMHVGATGAGNTAKLAINLLLGIHAQALAEAFVFAKEKGINIEDLATLLSNSALASPFLKIKSDAIVQDNFKPAFALKHIVKDLQLAKNEGAGTPLGTTALASFTQAKEELGEQDLIAILKHLK